jgi:hypothetical protein
MPHRIAAEKLDRALAWGYESKRHPQRRGLAGAVRAEEAVHVAGVDLEVDVIDGENLAVALDESASADGWRAAGRTAVPTADGRRAAGRTAVPTADGLRAAGRLVAAMSDGLRSGARIALAHR